MQKCELVKILSRSGNTIRAYLEASTAADLPAPSSFIGFTIMDGSTCKIRQTGAVYTMDGGQWYETTTASADNAET